MATRRALRAIKAPCSFLSNSSTPVVAHFRPAHARLQSSSSTQALEYKALHRRVRPLPVQETVAAWSAPAAVSSMIYDMPLPSQAPPKRHVLNCLVQNEPGVLSRVSGILAARGFNIDSLVVCNTEVEDLSRMTIVLQGQDGVVEQARRQLEDLVPVWAVLDYTNAPLVQRELLLAKVSIMGPEFFQEWLGHHQEMAGSVPTGEAASLEGAPSEKESEMAMAQDEGIRDDYHPQNLPKSAALRQKVEHLKDITYLTHQFGGKVLDISTYNCIVEVSAKPSRIDAFLKLVRPFGVLESSRTGLMALPRSPLEDPTESVEKEVEDVMDASLLPPS